MTPPVLLPAPSLVSESPAWAALKGAVEQLRPHLAGDGSLSPEGDLTVAQESLASAVAAVAELAPAFPHDAAYLAAVQRDLERWRDGGVGVPDFLDSLLEFHPEQQRVDGVEHLVVFPMYTQNGNPDRHLEAVLLKVTWPAWVAEVEAGDYANPMFVPVEFLDFTAGYDTNSAVLFPETVAVREVPRFTWGAIFCDREAARFRTVMRAALDVLRLELPADVQVLLDDQRVAQETFVLWDVIHDRTHMHGDLPFDPFMVKQRMPFWLYALEELRCDLTAFRAAVELDRAGVAGARLAQYAIVLDRALRFPLAGSRVRNYDGLGGQLLFAFLHRRRVVNWTDNRLSVDWEALPDAVLALLEQIEDLYWRSIDRPKVSHWLAAYELVTTCVEPHPASTWARGREALPLDGPPKELTNLVLPDEFPLSMFFEALSKKIGPVIESTRGIRA
ncbi:hypothetical protein EV189_3491 [Motilibacter rhizosphaerae]|uniref:Uncharacterized protein n=1 Tax=Motilibacter rhizosphaerae TaxID=598652 RepID=A0A4Q7NAP4_9ACTN|nr:DUF6421 family protein [Motilibacter rhizosphaerae]RZS80012.1 hypothetical protein EV189_3491 [Motilibacter rhizosphaerae]